MTAKINSVCTDMVLQMLGALGGGVNGGLLETSGEELVRVALAWDSQPRLAFPVPFIDMKPDIHLGESHAALSMLGWDACGLCCHCQEIFLWGTVVTRIKACSPIT